MTRTIVGIAVAHACLRHAGTLGWNAEETRDVAVWLASGWGRAMWRRYR